MTTTPELFDAIAEVLEYRLELSPFHGQRTVSPLWVAPDGTMRKAHPYPPSLDTLAAIWREELKGWKWSRKSMPDGDPALPGTRWNLEWVAWGGPVGSRSIVRTPDTDDMMNDFAALTLAALRVEKGSTCD